MPPVGGNKGGGGFVFFPEVRHPNHPNPDKKRILLLDLHRDPPSIKIQVTVYHNTHCRLPLQSNPVTTFSQPPPDKWDPSADALRKREVTAATPTQHFENTQRENSTTLILQKEAKMMSFNTTCVTGDG